MKRYQTIFVECEFHFVYGETSINHNGFIYNSLEDVCEFTTGIYSDFLDKYFPNGKEELLAFCYPILMDSQVFFGRSDLSEFIQHFDSSEHNNMFENFIQTQGFFLTSAYPLREKHYRIYQREITQ